MFGKYPTTPKTSSKPIMTSVETKMVPVDGVKVNFAYNMPTVIFNRGEFRTQSSIYDGTFCEKR